MNQIVAVVANWAIGRKGGMLFHMPGDLKYFREQTSGGTVIMGRKTLMAIPGCQPMPNRRNIIISRDPDFAVEGVEVASSIEAAMEMVKDEDPNKVWCIGGGGIYRSMLELSKYAYITKVDAIGGAEVFIENLDQKENWQVYEQGETMEENGFTYTFYTYKNQDVKPM